VRRYCVTRQCTEAEIEANYTDAHGASVIGFAFCHLLGFRLLPRLKQIGGVQLYRPDEDARYPGIDEALTRPIKWELIEQQYDQMVKYATALRLGTAEAEQVLRRFARGGPKHPPTERWRSWAGGADHLCLPVPGVTRSAA
jgi:TnpA family transposase